MLMRCSLLLMVLLIGCDSPPPKPAPAAPDMGAGAKASGADMGAKAVADFDELGARKQEALAKMTPQERALYERCVGKELDQCEALGKLYEDQARAAQDKATVAQAWRRATIAYKRGCQGGQPVSCVTLGGLYERGEGVKQQDIAAAALYKMACDAKHDAGCVALTRLQSLGRAGKVKSAVDVVAAEREACLKGVGQACARMGTRHTEGLGVDIDPAKAQVYFDAACKAKSMVGCHAVAVRLMEGAPDVAEDKEALKLFEQACETDLPEACYNAGFLYAMKRGGVKAKSADADSKRYLERACALKYAQACKQLGREVEPVIINRGASKPPSAPVKAP